jgi:hypothetical protein
VFLSAAPITPTRTPLTVKTADGVTHGGRRPVAVLAGLERSPAPDYRMRCARCVRDFTSSLRNAFRR